jgi:hypothetical protein
MRHDLIQYADGLSEAIAASGFRERELRDYTSKRIRNDEELQEILSSTPGLIDELVEIIDRRSTGGAHE